MSTSTKIEWTQSDDGTAGATTPYSGTLDDDLALWAGRRPGADLAAAVVSLTAPELAADRLVGVPEMASITGIAASTLRTYAHGDP